MSTNKIDLLVAAGGTVKEDQLSGIGYTVTMPDGKQHWFDRVGWDAAEYKKASFWRYIDATSE